MKNEFKQQPNSKGGFAFSLRHETRHTLKTLFVAAVAAVVACSHNPQRKRPLCTWKFWKVEGHLIREVGPVPETLPCKGPDAADCVGMTKEALKNLLECGAE